MDIARQDFEEDGELPTESEVRMLYVELDAARADLVASAQTAARFERERDELDQENLRLREQAGEMAIGLDAARARVAELEAENQQLHAVTEEIREQCKIADHDVTCGYDTYGQFISDIRGTLDVVPAVETTSGEACVTCHYPSGEPEPVRCPDCGH